MRETIKILTPITYLVNHEDDYADDDAHDDREDEQDEDCQVNQQDEKIAEFMNTFKQFNA